MRRVIPFILLAAFTLILVTALHGSQAQAVLNPHGGYSAKTAMCSTCHRLTSFRRASLTVETDASLLMQVKDVLPDTPVFANTGVRKDNVKDQLAIADGAVVGTTFKKDGYIWNPVDVQRVRDFMSVVRSLPGR